jgi:hypothetical protein
MVGTTGYNKKKVNFNKEKVCGTGAPCCLGTGSPPPLLLLLLLLLLPLLRSPHAPCCCL